MIFNLASKLNSNVASQNRRFGALEQKVGLCVSKYKKLSSKLDHIVHIIDNDKEGEIGVARAIKTKDDNT